MTDSEIFAKILIDGELTEGPIVAGDYTLGVRDIEGGHQLVITKGGQTQTLDVLDGLPGAQGPEGPAGQPGQPGQDGSDGLDGVSPTVSVAEITGGHRVTITDATGSHVFDVMDGANGQDGQPGQDGQDGSDGVSPTVDVDEITGGHRVTITDADGAHVFDVMDGETGAQGPQGPAGQDAVVDSTLTQAGQAADAKATGDEITGIKDALSELPKSVSAGGTALTPDTDGNVDVPVAARNVYGVIKTASTDYGIMVSDAGSILLVCATTSDINSKANQYKAITPSGLNAAIRAGLLSNSQITSADLRSIWATLGRVVCTQEEYDLMSVHDSNVEYVIVPDGDAT